MPTAAISTATRKLTRSERNTRKSALLRPRRGPGTRVIATSGCSSTPRAPGSDARTSCTGAEDERRVSATETKGIRQNCVDFLMPGLERDQVDLRFDGRVFQIQRGRRDSVAHGEDGKYGF